MNCDMCKENLAAFLDGQLTAKERQALQAHLNACTECARLCQELHEVDRIFNDKTVALEPAQRIWDKIQTEITSSEGPYRSPGLLEVAFWRQIFKQLASLITPRVRYARYVAASCATVLIALSLFLGTHYHSSYKTKQHVLAQIGKVQQEYLPATDRNPFTEAVRTESPDDNPFRTIDLKNEKNPFSFVQ